MQSLMLAFASCSLFSVFSGAWIGCLVAPGTGLLLHSCYLCCSSGDLKSPQPYPGTRTKYCECTILPPATGYRSLVILYFDVIFTHDQFQIKLATVVGMGLLLSLIGLSSAGVVVKNDDTMVRVRETGDESTSAIQYRGT